MVDGADSDVRSLVSAIVTGDIGRVTDLLDRRPELASATLEGNPRSMLHHATDWPAQRPNVATSIALLVRAGADPNAGMPQGGDPKVAETPLHWAASANDTAAVGALLDAGAVVDALGGIFGGCTPYEEAIIFEKYDAARLLLEHGATDYLPGAAALGDAHLVDSYFDADGNVRTDVGVLPNWDPLPTPQVVLDRAFQFACRAGHLAISKLLLDRGADPTAITPANTSALDEASENGHSHIVEWLRSI